MQSFRKDQPFDNLELAYGLMAYQDWLDGAQRIADTYGLGEELDDYFSVVITRERSSHKSYEVGIQRSRNPECHIKVSFHRSFSRN